MMKFILITGVIVGFLIALGEAPSLKIQIVSTGIGLGFMGLCGNRLINLLKREERRE